MTSSFKLLPSVFFLNGAESLENLDDILLNWANEDLEKKSCRGRGQLR